MSISPVSGGSSTVWSAQSQAPRTPPPMTSTAQLLGVSTSQLSQDLQSGTTLSSLASQANVSQSSLLSAVESDLQSHAPQGASALSSSQLTQIATNIANGTGPAGGATQAQSTAQIQSAGQTQSAVQTQSAGQTQSTGQAESNLAYLASTLGSDPSDLLGQLVTGQSLTSLLSGPSAAGYGTSIAQTISGGVAFDQYA